MKICKTCQRELDEIEFNKSPNFRDGLNSTCRECANRRSRDWQKSNQSRARATKRAWEEANPERVAAHKRRYREANREKVAAAYAKWVAENLDKKDEGRQRWKERNREAYLASCSRAGRNWRQANPEKVTAKTAKRRAQLRAAAVEWADREAMEAFYREARRLTAETGIEHQVDHIDPLQHPLVCGLHNQFNLRVVTADANRRKHNQFSPQRQGRLIA